MAKADKKKNDKAEDGGGRATPPLADDLQKLVDEIDAYGGLEQPKDDGESLDQQEASHGAEGDPEMKVPGPNEPDPEEPDQCEIERAVTGGFLRCLGDVDHEDDHDFDDEQCSCDPEKAEVCSRCPEVRSVFDLASVQAGLVDDSDESYESDENLTPWAMAVDQADRHVERDRHGKLLGETPVKYRMVFEFDPPVKGNKKLLDPVTGEMSNDVRRLEVFASNEMTFFILEVALSRALKPGQVKRMEAVILEPDSKVTWKDRNKDERE